MKKTLKASLKIAVSLLAVYLLYRTVDDWAGVWQAIKSANFLWLLLALVLFNVSKMISAFRLNSYFRCLGLRLSERFNLKLYYLGMLYNLVLPGGIGGDGYKVYFLNKRYGSPVKKLIGATLLDRLSGAVVLGFLALVLALGSTLQEIIPFQRILLGMGIALAFPLFYLINRKFFPTFLTVFFTSTASGFGVQLAQLFSLFCIVQAIGAQGSLFDFGTVFLVSSVAAALPISYGGYGIRELVFIYSIELFDSIKDLEQLSTACALIFFLITAISSLSGLYFQFKLKE